MKWIPPILVYFAVGIGMFFIRDAWRALFVFHLAIIASLLAARPSIPLSILSKSYNRKWILLSVLLCGSSGVTLYFLWSYFGVGPDFSDQVQSMGLSAQTWPPFIAYFSLVNPFLEEYFWRAYLGGPTKGLHDSDFLYAGFHGLILIDILPVGSILYSLAILTLAGWFWRQIMREDQGLLASILGHMAADFTIILAVYLHAQNLLLT